LTNAGVDADADSRPSFGSQNYVDLTAFYDYKALQIRVDAKNIFDKTSPIAGDPSMGNENAYHEGYEAFGLVFAS